VDHELQQLPSFGLELDRLGSHAQRDPFVVCVDVSTTIVPPRGSRVAERSGRTVPGLLARRG
jgi:hypothetical protein